METGKGVAKPEVRPTDRAQHLWDNFGSYLTIVRGKKPVPNVFMGVFFRSPSDNQSVPSVLNNKWEPGRKLNCEIIYPVQGRG